ncbi:hypothetical protein QZH41_010753 [Actinostola sp. cb2023]|nr:hypothetical protein QZH41_010753 [Actinostola sp. cb2023]
MLQISREYNPTHFTKPYYLDGYGSRSIGEPNWRPHPRNALSDPDAIPHSKMGGNGQDWYSSIRCPLPPPSRIRTPSKKDSSATFKNEVSSPRPGLSSKPSLDARPNYYNDERCIYRKSFELTLCMAIGAKKKVYCQRNGLPEIALGDKSYQVPEYSRNFHKHGSTLPTVSFG